MSDTLHVAPIGDQIQHDTAAEGADCLCGPDTIPLKRDDGSMGWLIVHHSLDGREHSEHGREYDDRG